MRSYSNTQVLQADSKASSPLDPSPSIAVISRGEPRTKIRPRFNTRTGRAYSTPSMKEAQTTLGWDIRFAMVGKEIDALSGFGVKMAFYTRTRQRRDIDNLIKLVLDAATGIVWQDDDQVSELSAVIWKSQSEPRTEITFYQTTPPLILICKHCGKQFRPGNSRREAQYCSIACVNDSHMHKSILNGASFSPCVTCGKRVYRNAEKTRAYSAHYCSPQCKRMAKTSEKVCRKCGVGFRSYTADKGLFCSVACSAAFFRDRKPIRPAASDGAHKMGQCSDCGGPATRRSKRCKACFVAFNARAPLTRGIQQ